MSKETKTKVMFHFPKALIEELDKYAERTDGSRGEAVRQLLRKALDAEKPLKHRNLTSDQKAALVMLDDICRRLNATGPVDAIAKVNRMLNAIETGDDQEVQ